MTATLLILAVLGWLFSVIGAVLDYRSATRLVLEDDQMYSIHQDEKIGRAAVLLIVGGASVGAGGTILAVLVTG